MSSIYRPHLMTITAITPEAPDVQTLRLEFQDSDVGRTFTFQPGQFGEFSAFGKGECPFCIASPPTRYGYIECTFRTTGRVTGELAEANIGDTIGFRGSYGNGFPIDAWRGKNLVFVAGGIGLPPVRSTILTALDRRDEFGEITIVYGARTADSLIYKKELEHWAQREDVRLVTTVDPGGESPGWQGGVGYVPTVLRKAAPSSRNAVAVVCGPPIMIKFSLLALTEMGFGLDSIFTTLENRMKCGLGKCGRCNVGSIYVCKDGPVFTAEQLKALPEEY